jgi:hypothetical protein
MWLRGGFVGRGCSAFVAQGALALFTSGPGAFLYRRLPAGIFALDLWVAAFYGERSESIAATLSLRNEQSFRACVATSVSRVRRFKSRAAAFSAAPTHARKYLVRQKRKLSSRASVIRARAPARARMLARDLLCPCSFEPEAHCPKNKTPTPKLKTWELGSLNRLS